MADRATSGQWTATPKESDPRYKLARCTVPRELEEEIQIHYKICLTDREISQLTGKVLSVRSSRERRLPLLADLAGRGIEELFVQHLTCVRSHEPEEKTLLEYTEVRDPNPTEPRERLVDICNINLSYMTDNQTRDIGFQIQRRILEFLNFSLKENETQKRAAALISCILDCRQIAKVGKQANTVLTGLADCESSGDMGES